MVIHCLIINSSGWLPFNNNFKHFYFFLGRNLLNRFSILFTIFKFEPKDLFRPTVLPSILTSSQHLEKGFIFHQSGFLMPPIWLNLKPTCSTMCLQSVQTDRGESSNFSFSPVLAEIMLHLLPVFLGSVEYLSLARGSDGEMTGGRLSMVAVTVLTLRKGVCLEMIERLSPGRCDGW